MSRNSKNATRKAQAKAITALHQSGQKAAAKTTPLHNKKWGYRSNPDVAKRIAEMVKATAKDDPKDKTAGKKILRKAGGASKDVVRAHVG